MSKENLKKQFRELVEKFDGKEARQDLAGSISELYCIEFCLQVLNEFKDWFNSLPDDSNDLHWMTERTIQEFIKSTD